MTLTNRSKKLLEGEGYMVDVVERWIPNTMIRKDLFGIFDLLAVKDQETLAIQVTSTSNVASRRTKMQESTAYNRVVFAGWGIELHGWSKKNGRFELKRERMV